MLPYVVIAMLLGILSTCLLHLAKSMERHGIEIFDQIRAKMKNQPSEGQGGMKKPTIYIIGLIINQFSPVWAIISGRYAPPSYFTSMFGLGLIVVMIYSAKVLKEPIQRIEYIGAIILILGTLILGIEGITRRNVDMTQINANKVYLFCGLYIFLGIVALIIGHKKNQPILVGILFGLFAGGCGGLDVVLKATGQNIGGEASFYPTNFEGWLIFLMSFGFGAMGFAITQWGFAKRARASILIPCYNSVYVVLPIMIQIFALPNFTISFITVIGLIFVISGIMLMQLFKREDKKVELNTQIH